MLCWIDWVWWISGGGPITHFFSVTIPKPYLNFFSTPVFIQIYVNCHHLGGQLYPPLALSRASSDVPPTPLCPPLPLPLIGRRAIHCCSAVVTAALPAAAWLEGRAMGAKMTISPSDENLAPPVLAGLLIVRDRNVTFNPPQSTNLRPTFKS